MLQVKDLSISYGAIQAVRHVDFEVLMARVSQRFLRHFPVSSSQIQVRLNMRTNR